MNTRVEQYLADEATMNWPGMVVGCRGPRRQGRTSSSDYVTPVTAAPCGCTLDCLQPITHRSSRDSCHFPFLRAYARGLQGYRFPPLVPLRRALPSSPPPPGHLERFKVEEQPPPTTHNHPRSQFSYASSNRPAAAITFAGKSSARYEGGQGWRCKGRACSTFPSLFSSFLRKSKSKSNVVRRTRYEWRIPAVVKGELFLPNR